MRNRANVLSNDCGSNHPGLCDCKESFDADLRGLAKNFQGAKNDAEVFWVVTMGAYLAVGDVGECRPSECDAVTIGDLESCIAGSPVL